MGEGTLTKMIITAYSDPELKNEIKSGENNSDRDKGAGYKVIVNPEKYSLSYKTEYKDQAPQGSSKPDLKFIHSGTQNLDLEFLFDRTGVIPGYPNDKEKGVEHDIEEFKRITFQYNGDNHKPNYLKILWGTLEFNCVLSEMNIDYKLFRSDGMPIRAIAKVKFRSFIDNDKKIAEEQKNSPDLTHIRTVIEGDTLPLMTYRIYGDSKYYLEVAKANQLTTFRKLKTGQKIYFPPLQKQS